MSNFTETVHNVVKQVLPEDLVKYTTSRLWLLPEDWVAQLVRFYVEDLPYVLINVGVIVFYALMFLMGWKILLWGFFIGCWIADQVWYVWFKIRSYFDKFYLEKMAVLKFHLTGMEVVTGMELEVAVPGSILTHEELPRCCVRLVSVDGRHFGFGVRMPTECGNWMVTPTHVLDAVLDDAKQCRLVGPCSKDGADPPQILRKIENSFEPYSDVSFVPLSPSDASDLGLKALKFKPICGPQQVKCTGPFKGANTSTGVVKPGDSFGTLIYTGTTTRGFSGAPYMDNKCVVGIHQAGCSVGNVNYGFSASFLCSLIEPVKESPDGDIMTGKINGRKLSKMMAYELGDGHYSVSTDGGKSFRKKSKGFVRNYQELYDQQNLFVEYNDNEPQTRQSREKFQMPTGKKQWSGQDLKGDWADLMNEWESGCLTEQQLIEGLVELKNRRVTSVKTYESSEKEDFPNAGSSSNGVTGRTPDAERNTPSMKKSDNSSNKIQKNLPEKELTSKISSENSSIRTNSKKGKQKKNANPSTSKQRTESQTKVPTPTSPKDVEELQRRLANMEEQFRSMQDFVTNVSRSRSRSKSS